MSKVSVRQAHSLSKAEAKEKLAGFEEMLKKYRVALEWRGDSAAIKGVGVSGNVAVSDAEVAVDLKLGMLARAAGIDAGRLQGSIARRLAEAYS
jgi:putative polyhydroxyalkanoate system protein